MKKSEEKTGNEKYKLWWILDYFFEKDRTDKNEKSIGKKAFAVGATAALIVLAAFTGTTAAQGDDWPYEGLSAVGYDSADEFGHFTLGGVYAPGSTVTVKTTAKGDYEGAVIIDVYDSLGTKIGTHYFSPMPGGTEDFDVELPADGPQGYYEIRANGHATDDFTVGYEGLNAVGYDSADSLGDLTLGGTYALGSTVTIKATAGIDYEGAVIIDVYDSLGTKIGTHYFSPMPGGTEDFDVELLADGPQGYYEIRANGIATDYFTVEWVPIPEFSTVTIPVVAILGLLYLFRRRGARKK